MKAIGCGSPYVLVATLGLAAFAIPASAQIPWATEFFSRQNKLEVYGVGEYLHQNDAIFPDRFGGTVKMKLDDTGLGGVGAAYHFSDFFSVHGDLLFGPATFHSDSPLGPPLTRGDNGLLQTGRINLDYNIINRRLTPFITAGIGYQYAQVEQPFGHYDYYGDYYSGFYYYDNYYSEFDFTWNVGAGIRWNITDNFFVKLTGGAQWLQYQDAHNVSTQIEAMFSIGMTIP